MAAAIILVGPRVCMSTPRPSEPEHWPVHVVCPEIALFLVPELEITTVSREQSVRSGLICSVGRRVLINPSSRLKSSACLIRPRPRSTDVGLGVGASFLDPTQC